MEGSPWSCSQTLRPACRLSWRSLDSPPISTHTCCGRFSCPSDALPLLRLPFSAPFSCTHCRPCWPAVLAAVPPHHAKALQEGSHGSLVVMGRLTNCSTDKVLAQTDAAVLLHCRRGHMRQLDGGRSLDKLLNGQSTSTDGCHCSASSQEESHAAAWWWWVAGQIVERTKY